MKMKNVFVALLLVISANVFAQSGVDKQVDKMLGQINTRLTSVSKKLKLSDAQEKEAITLYKEFVLERRKVAKKYEDKKERWAALKPKRQELNKKIKGLLNEKQLKAFKATAKKK